MNIQLKSHVKVSYVSRRIHTRRCCCTVCATLGRDGHIAVFTSLSKNSLIQHYDQRIFYLWRKKGKMNVGITSHFVFHVRGPTTLATRCFSLCPQLVRSAGSWCQSRRPLRTCLFLEGRRDSLPPALDLRWLQLTWRCEPLRSLRRSFCFSFRPGRVSHARTTTEIIIVIIKPQFIRRSDMTWIGSVTITIKSSTHGAITLSRMNLFGHVWHVTIFSWMFNIVCCLVVWWGLVFRVRIIFSVCLVSCYVHVFVRL